MLSRSPGGRVPALPAAGRAWRGLPGRDRLVRKPHHQAAALTQGSIIRSRVGDLVLRLRNVVTAVLVQLERHGGHPRSRKGRSPTPSSSSAPTDPCTTLTDGLV